MLQDCDEEDAECEDDFYADILKDDIIKLDEASTSAPPNLLKMEKSFWVDAEGDSPQFMHGLLSPPTTVPLPLPCTSTSQRIVFKDTEDDQTQEVMGTNNKDYNADKDKNQEWKWSSPTCLLTTSFAGKTVERKVSAIIAIIALIGFAVFLLGGFRGDTIAVGM